MALARVALSSIARPALRSAAAVGVRTASTQPDIPAHLQTKRPDYLLKFDKQSTVKEVYHYTSYFLAAGVPTALLLGAPVTSVLDLAMGVVIPLHFHIGMRSVLVDYVHEPAQQNAVLAVLAGVTALTAFGLAKFNLTDVGITEGVKSLWVEQDAPAPKRGVKPTNPF